MQLLPGETAQELYEEARLAAGFAYAPFSDYPVGAAVLTKNGNIFRGANIENASYGLTICAERIAIGNTISADSIDIVALAVYTEAGSAAPCGACRQFIIEFGKNIIVIFNQDGALVQVPISELLPYAFDKSMLYK